MICFVGVINIILVSILMKNLGFALRNLTKMTKLLQFFKNRDQIETKKNLEDQLDILDENKDQKSN